ncbi:hypothetical protein MHYP_G00225130 [Metynnis hypsauchen]
MMLNARAFIRHVRTFHPEMSDLGHEQFEHILLQLKKLQKDKAQEDQSPPADSQVVEVKLNPMPFQVDQHKTNHAYENASLALLSRAVDWLKGLTEVITLWQGNICLLRRESLCARDCAKTLQQPIAFTQQYPTFRMCSTSETSA